MIEDSQIKRAIHILKKVGHGYLYGPDREVSEAFVLAINALRAHLEHRIPVTDREPDGEWERCNSCGERYPDIYWADDEQWAQVVGDEFAGLRCPECFKREAWDMGLEPVLRFLAPPLTRPGPVQEAPDDD